MKELFKKYIYNKASKKEIKKLFKLIDSGLYDHELKNLLEREKNKFLFKFKLKKITYLLVTVILLILLSLLFF